MAIMEVLKIPNSFLYKKTKPIDTVDLKIRKIFDDMRETMFDSCGIGLAANQVGVDKRLIVINLNGDEDRKEQDAIYLANPKIEKKSDEMITYSEGCLSIPGFYEDVLRHEKITVSYIDYNNVRQKINATGLLSICLQHEIDHLNGIVFIDHIREDKKEFIEKSFA